MEPDLPLIEIPGEEDKLIQSLAHTSASASPLFSPIARSNDKGDAARYNASGFSNGNKENINVNKSEMTKLSVEPQQMKRRKKGSAYNSRKSLAWDKAFLTDEGVLDPLELSMLGGSNDTSCRELLPCISEDGGMFSGNSYSRDDSTNLQGTPKSMSNKKCGNSGSKSCCPRPLVFSSLKRPANASILKAAAKESKLPKLPVSKSGAHSLLKISKSNLPSTSQNFRTKDNQIGREDVQKVAGTQITSKFTRTSTSKRKPGSDSVSRSEKSPTQQSRRNKGMPAGKLFSSSDLQPRQSSLAGRANCGHKAPSAALPPSGSDTADSHEVVRRDKSLSGKVSVAATTSLVQSRKPSGLRMPSPSLGFFSQPKSSVSNSSIQKAIQPINTTGSNVPNSRKLNVLNCTYDPRLPHVPVKSLKKVDNNSSSGSSDVSRPSSECVSSSDYDNTHENVKAKLAQKGVLVKECKVSFHAKSEEGTKDNEAVQRTTDCDIEIQESENSYKVDQTSFLQHMDFQKNDNHCLIVDKSYDQLKIDGKNVIVDFSERRGSDDDHLENTNFVSQISCPVFDQDVHETTDTVYRQHVKDNQSSSSTVVHGSCQIPCLLLSTKKVDQSEKDDATNVLYIGNTEVQTFNGRNRRFITSGTENLVSEVVFADTNVESVQPLELHLPSLVADQFCNENHDMPLNDCPLVSEVTSGEGNCLSTALTVQEQTDINPVQLSMGGSGVFVEGVNEKQSLDYELPGSIDTETLDEHDINSFDTDFKSDVVLSGEATCIESCVASIERGAQTFGSTSTYEQFHSSGITGFIDQKLRASAESINTVDTGVNKINSTSSADIDFNVTQENESLITDYEHDRDNSSCLTEDANATIFTKRSGDGGTIDNLAIKPSIHAIPFSDEWLSAMEAAGEEILTMKRGAVQNSPTEKALPEPSPWSPVKKKQNQIGPNDCTKFSNVPHSSDQI